MLSSHSTGTDGLGRLRRTTLFAYGLPGLPLAILMLPVFVHLPVYYATDLGLGLATVGAILLVARLWDVVTDPVIGLLSDRFPTALGRRRPWMLAGVPLLLVSAAFLFMPGSDVGWAYLLAWTFALYLGGTMVTLPYSAWGAELSSDYYERSRITAWREAMMVLGVLIAAGLPTVLGYSEGAALTLFAWILIVLLPVTVLIAAAMVPEGQARQSQSPDYRGGWRLIAANGPFRRLIAAYFLNGIANGLPATLFLLFVEFGLGRPDWSGILLFTYFACGIAAVPFWLAINRRVGKHKTWIGAMLCACLVFAFVPLLGQGDVVPFLLICIVTGACLGADLILPPSMQADVIDLDRLNSGRERAGTFFALWGIATKLALALAVGLAFPILEGFGFSAEGANGDTPLLVLVVLYSLVPIAFKVAAIVLMAGYPITAERQQRLRAEIDNQRGLAVEAAKT